MVWFVGHYHATPICVLACAVALCSLFLIHLNSDCLWPVCTLSRPKSIPFGVLLVCFPAQYRPNLLGLRTRHQTATIWPLTITSATTWGPPGHFHVLVTLWCHLVNVNAFSVPIGPSLVTAPWSAVSSKSVRGVGTFSNQECANRRYPGTPRGQYRKR